MKKLNANQEAQLPYFMVGVIIMIVGFVLVGEDLPCGWALCAVAASIVFIPLIKEYQSTIRKWVNNLPFIIGGACMLYGISMFYTMPDGYVPIYELEPFFDRWLLTGLFTAGAILILWGFVIRYEAKEKLKEESK